VDVEDHLLEDEETDAFKEYTSFIYGFITSLPRAVESFEMMYQCDRRPSLPILPQDTFMRLESLHHLNIGWYISNEELAAFALLPHLEYLLINLPPGDRLPSVTYPSPQNLDIIIQDRFPQKVPNRMRESTSSAVITCKLNNLLDAEGLINFTNLLGEHQQIRDITL
jgi:hypothetical protein